MMSDDHQRGWALAFARQGRADLDRYNFLVGHNRHQCHALLFLQMACEKIAKARRVLSGEDLKDVVKSHRSGKGIPQLIRHFLSTRNVGQQTRRHKDGVVQHATSLCRQIELLSPSVTDDNKRPDNVEYPWEREHQVIVPIDFMFPINTVLLSPNGRAFLKYLDASTDMLITELTSS